MKPWRTWQAKRRAFAYYLGGAPWLGALLRWAAWRIRCFLHLPAVVDIPRLGFRLYLLPRWKGCWKAIYVFRDRFFEVAAPELGLVPRILRPGDVFVDAGAFHGWYTLTASHVVGGDGLVVAVEPSPEAYGVLTRNLTLNDCRNVKAVGIALSDADGEAWLYQEPDDGVANSLARVQGWTHQERVATRRLDEVLEEIGVRMVHVLKIDVEGAEAHLLRGARGVLTTCRPVVIFEVNPVAAANMGVPVRSAWDTLAAFEYSFFRFSAGTLIPIPDFPEVPAGTVTNVVAIHRASRSAGA